MNELLYKEDAFKLMGLCMQVHRELRKGHDKIIFKDAFVVELNSWQFVVIRVYDAGAATSD